MEPELFEPENKKEALQLNKEQQKLKVEYAREYTQIVQKYIKGDERSFTIIAFPLPEIGMDYEEVSEVLFSFTDAAYTS